MTTRHPLRAAALLAVALSFVVMPAPAWADEEEGPDLATQIEDARKAKDDGAATVAVKKVPAAYKLAEKAERGKLVSAVGKVLKEDDLDGARLAAIEALIGIEDPKPAWKQLAKEMPDGKKTEEASPFQLAVVKAAGVLAQKRAVKPLIELAAKAKDPNLAAEAAGALGGYHDDVKGRVKLLEELVDIGLKTRPGRSTSKAVSPTQVARWQAVGPRVVHSLIRLTGRTETTSFEAWEQLYKDNKKNLKVLFQDDE